jgi:hypothetical protein
MMDSFAYKICGLRCSRIAVLEHGNYCGTAYIQGIKRFGYEPGIYIYESPEP